MLFRFLSLIGFIALSQNASAQMATASIFPEMKAINPATLGLRPAPAFAMYASIDNSEKEQNLSSGEDFNDGSLYTEEGTLSSYNAFYATGGGALAFETLVDISSGDLDFGFELPGSTQSTMSLSAEATSTYLGVGVGLGKFFGVNIGKFSIEMTDKFETSLSIGGEDIAINTTTKTEVDTMRMRAGLRGSFILNFGLYYEIEQTETTSDAQGHAGTSETDTGAVGFGVGTTTSGFHFEVFYEQKLDDIESATGPITPTRYGGTIETKFGSMVLGYTGMFYTGGFGDLERTMYDLLIYGDSKTEDRLENIINFAFGGGSKGHSFGGSAFFSSIETTQGNKLDSSGTKYPTTIEAKGASLKYSYAF